MPKARVCKYINCLNKISGEVGHYTKENIIQHTLPAVTIQVCLSLLSLGVCGGGRDFRCFCLGSPLVSVVMDTPADWRRGAASLQELQIGSDGRGHTELLL